MLYPGSYHTTLPHRDHQGRGSCPSQLKTPFPIPKTHLTVFVGLWRDCSMETVCKHFQFIGCGSD